eukprot:15448159-Alexandrium_andersonii.AAC.1
MWPRPTAGDVRNCPKIVPRRPFSAAAVPRSARPRRTEYVGSLSPQRLLHTDTEAAAVARFPKGSPRRSRG